MEGGGHEPNELDRLIRSLGNEHVPAGSQREQEAQLFVTPPLREVVHEPFESMMMLQQQQLVPPRFTDAFLNPLAVPSPTAEWLNFMSMTNNDPLQGPAYSSAAAAAASASAFATTSSTGGFLTFQQLQRDLLSSDSAAAHDFANSAWDFVENQITPEIGNFPAGNNSEPLNLDAIQELLNTTMISGSNPHLTGSRTPQFLMPATHQSSGHHQHQLAGDSDFYNHIRRASPPQTQFHSPSPPSSVGSVSPVQTSRSFSTHGGRRSPSLARLPNSADMIEWKRLRRVVYGKM
ncbi:unnamed protein product [Sphagnum jensenii]|uniref:Uncharacterized protein n=1 Tax=Sphagnum jensenii TaxID=128206 RepID=A0ABP0W340_9BRYO